MKQETRGRRENKKSARRKGMSEKRHYIGLHIDTSENWLGRCII